MPSHPDAGHILDIAPVDYGVEVVGSANDMYEQFYAISPERKIRQPLVLNICDRARTEVFGTG